MKLVPIKIKLLMKTSGQMIGLEGYGTEKKEFHSLLFIMQILVTDGQRSKKEFIV